MLKLYTENHNWKDNHNHTVALFELVKVYIDKYDRSKWALKNRFTPTDWDTADSKEALNSIVEDLIILFDDDTFSVGGCEMMIKNAISIQDNRSVPQSIKAVARGAALEAGFINEDDLAYINMMDDPENTLNFKIVNNEFTPEQLLEHIDNPLAQYVLKYQHLKYNKGDAFIGVLKLHNLKLADLPKHLKEEAKKVMKDFDNAYIQFIKSKIIIEQYVIKKMAS